MEVAGRLAPGVAHELSNPLAAIVGFSQLIRGDSSLPEDLRHNAELLAAEAERTQDIAGNLLDFLTHRPPERRSTSIRALIDSVLTLQASSLGAGTIEVEVDVPDDLPPVELDRGQIQQVLVNLTRNAIEAVAGRARAGVEGSGSTLFERGNPVPTSGFGSRSWTTGVASHPSRWTEYSMRSSAPNRQTRAAGSACPCRRRSCGRTAATCFLGHLPGDEAPRSRSTCRFGPPRWRAPTSRRPQGLPAGARRPPGKPPETRLRPQPLPRGPRSAAATPTVGRGGRVLVLDDDSTFRAFLEKALAALGYEPVIAARGQEAVDLARDGDLAAILCDHQMVGMSGIEVYEAVVGNRPDLATRFVMMSGDVLDPALEAFAATHEMTRLAKPFDLATLDHTLRGVMSDDGQSRG